MTNSKFKGALLTTTVIAGVVFSSPAFAQQVPPATTSPSNTTSETPTAPEEQVPAPGKGSNGAQTTTDQKGEQAIVVTGTVSKQTQTASPVTVVTASNLQDRGVTTVADAVQQLAANNAGADPPAGRPSVSRPAPAPRRCAASTMRTPSRCSTACAPLTIRSPTTVIRNFVDINTIPESIVDRIDVLQDGASANYGSDAIAAWSTSSSSARSRASTSMRSAGISQHGDAGERRLSATAGYGDSRAGLQRLRQRRVSEERSAVAARPRLSVQHGRPEPASAAPTARAAVQRHLQRHPGRRQLRRLRIDPVGYAHSYTVTGPPISVARQSSCSTRRRLPGPDRNPADAWSDSGTHRQRRPRRRSASRTSSASIAPTTRKTERSGLNAHGDRQDRPTSAKPM